MSSKVCSQNFSTCSESLSCWDCHLQEGDPGVIGTGTSSAYYTVWSLFLLFYNASTQNGIAIFYGWCTFWTLGCLSPALSFLHQFHPHTHKLQSSLICFASVAFVVDNLWPVPNLTGEVAGGFLQELLERFPLGSNRPLGFGLGGPAGPEEDDAEYAIYEQADEDDDDDD